MSAPHRPRVVARVAATLLAVLALLAVAAGCSRDRGQGGQAAPPASTPTSQPGGAGQPGVTVPGQATAPTITLQDPATTQPPAAAQTSNTTAPPVRAIRILSPAEGATVGRTFDLRLDVTGFALVEPNGNMDGTSGHLYVIVDGPAPPPNQLIRPSSGPVRLVGEQLTLRNLRPGRHTILVIGANGYTVPFEPPVEARRTVVVSG